MFQQSQEESYFILLMNNFLLLESIWGSMPKNIRTKTDLGVRNEAEGGNRSGEEIHPCWLQISHGCSVNSKVMSEAWGHHYLHNSYYHRKRNLPVRQISWIFKSTESLNKQTNKQKRGEAPGWIQRDKMACTVWGHFGVNNLKVLSLGWYINQDTFFTLITNAFWYHS